MYNLILSEKAEDKWVEICAWCDMDKTVTNQYICEGYKASHGICQQHCDEVIKETIEYYEKNGFNIAADASDPNGVWDDTEHDI